MSHLGQITTSANCCFSYAQRRVQTTYKEWLEKPQNIYRRDIYHMWVSERDYLLRQLRDR